ncbi:DNA-binding response regulator [Thiosulfatimonas sediminis]|uniref:DNA-binding response regulator n=1 Tax=Thiosulfatimonas sediminis TaxID=2675054 RepID=A0A6F8PY13_9GAMM|nr:response regulator transcription factor [Thiosulfatimonas sediminis]BBP47042.1 DNA-binding response regulator [Thiosulfatimonas sediminis]
MSASQKCIAILEDDPLAAEVLKTAFDKNQLDYQHFTTIAELQQALPQKGFALLMLDWQLPDGTADQVIEWVRERMQWQVPIIVQSIYEDEEKVVNALSMGADEYLIKPLRQSETVARVQAMIRRAALDTQPQLWLKAGNLEVDTLNQKVFLDGKHQDMTRIQVKLMTYLLQHLDVPLSREHLLRNVWDKKSLPETRTVDAHINQLRKRLNLDDYSQLKIESVHGYGYCCRLEP